MTQCDKLWAKKAGRVRDVSGTGTGGGGEVPPVGGLIQEDQQEDVNCQGTKSEETIEYRRHQYEKNPAMKLTGEDMHLVLDCDCCGPDLVDLVRKGCEECGDGWVREDYTLCILGNDVVALFPSLDSETTGKIVRGEVTRSTITIEGFSTKLGLKYIAMNEEYTSDLGPLRKRLPTRLKKPG